MIKYIGTIKARLTEGLREGQVITGNQAQMVWTKECTSICASRASADHCLNCMIKHEYIIALK